MIYSLHPTSTANIWDFLIKRPVAQKRDYSCDKTSRRQANRDVSYLMAKFLPFCNEKSKFCSLRIIRNTVLFMFET
jgi:hypothetical protein